ncbi:hypothetical protein CK203_039069 [Vitis vinifera]|uniref:Uncharacterized protein n=1 Tax=Vitis vinifera TaxID=29760 RepID=A0A438IGQ5_VITVI|nr:hypothetical protein CK203_039069 [Vitis vinifera]
MLKHNKDIFAWTHSDMPGIHLSVASHKLNISPTLRPIRQKSPKAYQVLAILENPTFKPPPKGSQELGGDFTTWFAAAKMEAWAAKWHSCAKGGFRSCEISAAHFVQLDAVVFKRP